MHIAKGIERQCAYIWSQTNYVKIVEDRQGLKIACIEEIAYRMGFIDEVKLAALADKYKKNNYGKYLTIEQRKIGQKDQK